MTATGDEHLSELPEPQGGFPELPAPVGVDSEEGRRELMLMQYFDGELDDATAAAFAAEMSEDDSDKLACLALSEELLLESIDADPRGDGIADWVIGKIDSEAQVLQIQGSESQDHDQAGDDAVARPDQPGQVVPLVPNHQPMVQPPGRLPQGKPANDNARSIFALAAAAAAVAAGLFFWGRSEPTDMASGPTITPPAATVSKKMASKKKSREEPVVEVDFGSQQGSVFYVDGEKGAASMSAVVWITDGE